MGLKGGKGGYWVPSTMDSSNRGERLRGHAVSMRRDMLGDRDHYKCIKCGAEWSLPRGSLDHAPFGCSLREESEDV
jgi:hypothetical protein